MTASSPFHSIPQMVLPPCDIPDSSLLIEKMLSQQQIEAEDENRLPIGPSRRSDFASPITSIASANFKNIDEFSSQKIRVSAPPSTHSNRRLIAFLYFVTLLTWDLGKVYIFHMYL